MEEPVGIGAETLIEGDEPGLVGFSPGEAVDGAPVVGAALDLEQQILALPAEPEAAARRFLLDAGPELQGAVSVSPPNPTSAR